MNYNATENSKPKLLIVDDERDNIRILFGSLREDYDIVAADSGTLALEKALAERPDVILLDIVMPDMDGYEVIVRLKETGETADIPVIFITGLISPQDESKGFALGAADYIAKPFNIDVVRARVKTQLQIAGTIHSGVIARQIAETELQNAHALINSAPQYISYTDANGRYVFINPATYEVTGYSHDELMAGGIYLLHDDDSKRRINDEIIPALNTLGRYYFELPVTRKDGEVRVMAFSSFKVHSNIGSIATDITEQKHLLTEMLKAKNLAETANNAKEEFLSRMSHELRTPLNAIMGMTAIAKASKDLGQIADSLAKIDSASKHLTILVNEILDMATINEGKFELIYGQLSVRKMAERIVEEISRQSAGKHQALNIHIEEDVPDFIVGDEHRLSKIITNLLSNAIKFTPENGVINLRISKVDEQYGCCTLQFQIKDNGIGIPPEHQAQIFSAFEQADGGSARTYGGAGLGLALSRQFVELMGGSLWVDSSPGCGSTFFFTIKAEIDNAEHEMPDKAAHGSERLEDYVILVADDVEINREVVAAILEDTGAILVFAEDGREAVELFKRDSERYSLILMDINMPNMDGYQATAAIRSLGFDKARRIPIIAMTANTYKTDIERCLSAGMNDHIGKPIDFNDLLDKAYKYGLLHQPG